MNNRWETAAFVFWIVGVSMLLSSYSSYHLGWVAFENAILSMLLGLAILVLYGGSDDA